MEDGKIRQLKGAGWKSGTKKLPVPFRMPREDLVRLHLLFYLGFFP